MPYSSPIPGRGLATGLQHPPVRGRSGSCGSGRRAGSERGAGPDPGLSSLPPGCGPEAFPSSSQLSATHYVKTRRHHLCSPGSREAVSGLLPLAALPPGTDPKATHTVSPPTTPFPSERHHQPRGYVAKPPQSSMVTHRKSKTLAWILPTSANICPPTKELSRLLQSTGLVSTHGIALACWPLASCTVWSPRLLHAVRSSPEACWPAGPCLCLKASYGV